MKKFSKILLYDFLENEELINILKKYSNEVILIKATDDYQNILNKKDFDGVDCFITNVFDYFNNDFFKDTKIKFIGTLFTDLSMFDLEFIKKENIIIKNINGQASNAVAEFSLNILLNILRKTCESLKFSKGGGEGFLNFKGKEIFGKKVGIIGMGGIGKRFSEILSIFGTKIIYSSKTKKDLNYDFVKLDDLFDKSDFIFISTNLNSETNKMIKINDLNKIKGDTIILNPSRIELFNLDDLYKFLIENKNVIFWQDESINDEWKKVKDKFIKLDNFIITPHNAFNTEENPIKAIKLLEENLIKFNLN